MAEPVNPELIPMPGGQPPDNRGPMPALTRELSEAEEKDVLLQFMGGQYGELHKIDNNIIGGGTLQQGKSHEVKQQITQLVQQPTPPPVVAPPAPALQPQVSEPQPVPQPVPQQVEVKEDNQLTFNFDITEKDLLFDKLNKLDSKLDRLHHKLDRIFEVVNTKRTTKKKSVESQQK